MKKTFYLTIAKAVAFILLVCSSASVHAQYTATPIPYTPYPYNGGVMFNVPDDQYSSILPIGFNFTFYGNSYNKLVVSSNGYITFDTTTASAYSPWPISGALPLASGSGSGIDSIMSIDSTGDTTWTVYNNNGSSVPLNAIMGPWEDIYNPAGGAIYYANYGVAPNRVLVLAYDTIPFYIPSICTGPYYTGQIVLHESSNIIDVFIKHKDTCTGWNGAAAIEGVINADGSVATIVPGRNYPTKWTAYNDGYRFSNCPAAANPVDTIRGHVYADLNHNCQFDSTDYGLAQQVVTAGCVTAYTDSNGFYVMTLDNGAYTVTHGLTGFTQDECPATNSYNVNLTTTGSTLGNIDFADTLSGNCTDVSLAIGTWILAKCTDNQYTAYYCNNGTTTTLPLTLTVTMPDSVYITGSDVAPASVTGNTYTFNVSPVGPGGCGIFHFTDSVACGVSMGDYLCVNASISGTPDCDTTNNYAVDCHAVVASYDPNNMVVSNNSLDYNNGHVITNNDSLVYQVNFQNTGTLAAQNVTIIDTLPASLNYSTVVSSIGSHPYTFSNNNGILTWTFMNINLPDSGTNQNLSHAFVRFKVKQMPGNAQGTIIPNQASILFDYNPAVSTNSANDTIGNPTGVAVISSSNFAIYPNPAHDAIHIQYDGKASDASVTVYNELGATVQSNMLLNKNMVINTKAWAKGVYFIRIVNKGAVALTRSIIVE